MNPKTFPVLIGAACLAMIPSAIQGQVVYSDDFNTDTSANYNIFVTAGSTGPSGDATFAYNYGAAPGSGGLAIPVAPHTTDSTTLGLRLRTDNLQSSVGTVVGATEIVTKGLSLTTPYKVTVDVWSDYIGSGTSIAGSGANGTTGVAVGIGTTSSTIQYIAANNGLIHEAFGDNGAGANQSYRLYLDGNHPNPTTASYWAAGTGANSATYSDPYYGALGPSVAAPAAQSAFSTTQGGSTAAGTLGFAWHTWTITDDGANIIWDIDGKTITTVPVSAVTLAGSQVSLGNDDTGLAGSSAANNQLFNAEIFDNFEVTLIPEPAIWSLGLVGALGCFFARRRRR